MSSTALTSSARLRSPRRLLSLLRTLARHHATGVRLRDLVAESGVDRSTAHRLMACLVDDGFAARVDGGPLYRLGVEALRLGLVATERSPLVDRFRPLLIRLARRSEDTVYLMVRQGDYVHCLHREEGRFPIKAFTVDIGSRRLLGVSAVGVALLAIGTDADVDAILQRRRLDYRRVGLSGPDLKHVIERTRANGFAETEDLATRQTSGVGVAALLAPDTELGISIAAIHSRMPAGRRAEIAGWIRAALPEVVP